MIAKDIKIEGEVVMVIERDRNKISIPICCHFDISYM